ncbi:lysophospholipid acyltransferase family protein [Candidatus Avelusimicrobium luingense]|uniref:lysophospholipid acyltransferase family protein n=1 Tax=Candidatus Avelusimicrobium luingense TaxID=3416211 RepID=UPI003D14CC26
MTRLRTFFNTVVIGTVAISWLVLSSLVAAVFLNIRRDKTGRAVRKFVFIQSRGIVWLMQLAGKSLRVDVSPRPSGPCVVVANHASALDLYTISAFGFDNVVYITKGWVFKLPFFRYVMNSAGYIDAEKTPPEQMLNLCRQAVQKGCDIVLFPQGSRKDPQARFKSGAFYLAKQLDLPVVPVAICGTQTMLPAGHFTIAPAHLVLKSFPAVLPADYPGELGHLHMAQAVKKQIMDVVNQETELCNK